LRSRHAQRALTVFTAKMAMLETKTRALVTGFCAAHAQLNASRNAWREYSQGDAPGLSALFDGKISGGKNSGEAGFPLAPDKAWWERFYACGIIGALETAGLWRENELMIDPCRVGISFSSSKGRPAQREKQALQESSFFENSVFADSCDWALREIARITGACGKRACPVAACAGGSHAIALGAQWIEDGVCDVVVCGAIEAEIADLVLAGYKNLGALSARKIMRPFDVARDGFVPAPGAACLILESAASARKRGAKNYGAISGWSFWSDATSLTGLGHSGESIMRAMRNAAQRAARSGSTPDASVLDVGYINAHGTATKMNDEIEARAIDKIWGKRVPVSSTKPLTGHTLGAAGAIEAVLCLLAMQQSFAPPNLNLETQDANCEIEVLKVGREIKIESAISLSYGFGGHIGVLLLEKDEN
jgi:3-oxoacyl-(acyl-carrier-protein) synthase